MHPVRHGRLVAFLALALFGATAAFAATGPSTSTAPSPAASLPGAESCEGDLALAFEQPSFTPAENGAVWTHHDGCHAQLTCDSNCIKSCIGTVCSVGSNYVQCDGVKSYCPSCDLGAYPGYPTCGLRQCPWCVCVSNGGSSQECCSYGPF